MLGSLVKGEVWFLSFDILLFACVLNGILMVEALQSFFGHLATEDTFNIYFLPLDCFGTLVLEVTNKPGTGNFLLGSILKGAPVFSHGKYSVSKTFDRLFVCSCFVGLVATS